MLNHAVRTYLPVFQDQLRPSLLGRATGRKMHNLQQPGAADEDEAKPSPATDEQVRKFFDAWHTGNDGAQSDALNRIVRTWRADNAAGGVLVHAHLVLPRDFADKLVEITGDVGAMSTTSFKNVLESLDEGVQTLVAQQLAAAPKERSGPFSYREWLRRRPLRTGTARSTSGFECSIRTFRGGRWELENEKRMS